ncbi:J domain-containing protein [Pseudarthrobacter sp. MDT3-26]|uniref:J domain-containing protein n=1 Tax=Pseudarthrobacter raffinosi TaxID=2953651 RepID=UPI00208E0825|nr:J domain-containing protein [Pseudarthrobacter sp. MDT3-26]MCO4263313.1 J domain-containing protein [Pseudarthrobacter sp. MDT3-26]
MTSQPDYYDVLRVKPAASQQEISRAYRVLMRTRHPDLDGGATVDRDVQDGELLRIMQAFAVLRDAARRATYDRSRNGPSAPGGTPTVIPVRKVSNRYVPAGNTIRITTVRWESGPWK